MGWRPMRADDLSAVHAIAERLHPDHPEDREIAAERLRLFPAGCLVLEREGAVVGYAIGHPWTSGSPPPLNTRLHGLPDSAATFHIHDLAVLPDGRGQGLALEAVERLVALARTMRLESVSLVAVNRSGAFWKRLGFVQDEAPDLSTKLLSYGGDAAHMLRRLNADEH